MKRIRKPGICSTCGGPTSRTWVTRCRACYRTHFDISAAARAGRAAQTARQAGLDAIAVERLVMGRPPAVSTRAERQRAVAILTRRGLSARRIAETIGVSQRTVVRLRGRGRAA